MLKPEQAVQQQPMAPMPFYADPTRFSTPVWQAETTQTWPQGQFIQQIAPAAQPAVQTLEPYGQQYPNGLYQTTYQQPGFETNTFYAGAVQVLTNTRPPSASEHPQLTPRTNGSYSHTPSPVPQTPQQPSTPRSNISAGQYQEYMSNQGYVAPSTPTGNLDNQSRPSSVNSAVNAPSTNQVFQSIGSTSNFSPSSNTNPSYVTANSGNGKPGYTQVSSSPQLASHNSSGYPGNQFSGETQTLHHQNQDWQIGAENMMWEPHIHPQQESSKDISQAQAQPDQELQENLNEQFSSSQPSSNRVELNSRLKTMILNKQISGERKVADEAQMGEADNNKATGHFLWYSHHRHPPDIIDGGGGVPYPGGRLPGTYLPPNITPTRLTHSNLTPSRLTPNKLIPTNPTSNGFTPPPKNFNPTTNLTPTNNLTHAMQHYQSNQVINQGAHAVSNGNAHHHQVHYHQQIDNANRPNTVHHQIVSRDGHLQQPIFNQIQQVHAPPVLVGRKVLDDEKAKNIGTEIPLCNCFPADKLPPEPGSYYTHLGCSSSLINLRKDFETRTGVNGKAIRIEKVRYTGKEGKTPQGCPIAKWIIRRSNYDEKYLVIVKHRQGHVCISAYIVVCIVAWEGVAQPEADGLYSTLTEKLNKFGLPTTRRCATNEQRTCACQGLDPKTCGASFSFGCSWSMYYNGCKFARSKIVRKFRLTERTEEENMETKLQSLTTCLGPLYRVLAPDSFKNQCVHENDAVECRLGLKEGRPFSGVTACVDFCAHAHKDSHNMNDGCTAVVTLTKERSLAKHNDEQLHVLPLYSIDGTDEFGSKEDQDEKYKNGSVEVLTKYECEVRIRTVPLQPCRRRKKKEEDNHSTPIKKDNTSRSSSSSGYESSRSQTPVSERVLQSNHVSSTRLDSPITPPGWMPNNLGGYHHHHQTHFEENPWLQQQNVLNGGIYNSMKNSVLIPNNSNTAFDVAYPKHEPFNRFDVTSQPAQRNYSQNKVQDSHSGIRSSHSLINSISTTTTVNNIIDYSTGIVNTNRNDSSIYNGIITSKNQSMYNHFSSTPLKGSPYPFKVPSSPIPHISTSYNPAAINITGFHQNHFGYNPHNKPFYTSPSYHHHLHHDVWYNHHHHHQDINKNFYYKQQPFMYSPKPLPPIHFFNNNQNINPNTYHLRNPFDDISDFGTKRFIPFPNSHESEPTSWQSTKLNSWDPVIAEQPESLGKVIDIIDNAESFADSQVGGVAIALTHGSVLFECAKHELHATTALKKPNRLSPTRISLVFYQHRNLNRPKHGWDQWEEKTRLKKLGLNEPQNLPQKLNFDFEPKIKLEANDSELLMRAPTLTTMSVTTLFPMYPCIVTGPYKEQQSF